MTPEQFCYWLQGVFEVGNIAELNVEQVKIVKQHLGLVLTNVTQLSDPPIRDDRPRLIC